MRALVLLLLILYLPLSHVLATTQEDTEAANAAGAAIIDPPALLFHILDQGGPRTVATNWGYIGSNHGRLLDTARGNVVLPWEYPTGSGIEYLYDAGLWVGGIVGGDTLVSTGTMSYEARHELFPDTGAAGALIFTDFQADVEYTAACTDTFSDPNIASIDLVDGVHRPMSILLRQKSRAWADPDYRDVIWTDVTIINGGDKIIQDTYIGWMVDPDIGHVDIGPAYADDLVGYYRGTAEFGSQSYPVDGVYAIDNDGDPDTLGAFSERSTTGALGLMVLPPASAPIVKSFNWWVYNSYRGLDWGPHYPSADPATPELPGRPLGDAARYRMMSNGEIDYDQIFSAVDKTAEGWAPPPDTAFFAAGYDIRFLYSIGPYTLYPGDSVTLNFIWVAGSNIHTDPEHFANTFDYNVPELFLDGLDFSDLGRNFAAAHHLYGSDFIEAAPGPPTGLSLASWTTDRVSLKWLPKGTLDLANYEVFRRTPGFPYPVDPVAIVPADGAVYPDYGLLTAEYVYTVRSRDTGGRLGPPSPEIQVDLRLPMPVELFRPVRVDEGLQLSWSPSPYPDVARYRIERYRETAPGDTAVVYLGETPLTHFIDAAVEEATLYEYAVMAESAGGVTGAASNRVRGMAMAFDQGPLIIDQTPSNPSGLTNKDSVAAFWQRILPQATYRDMDPEVPLTLSLYDFNHHPVTIIVSSGLFPETEHIRSFLKKYDIAGGRVLFVGRDLFNVEELPFGDRYFARGDYEYDCLGLTRIHYPTTLLSHPTRMNAEFIGARSCAPGFPDLAVDATRTNWGIPLQLQPVGPAIPFVGWVEGDPMRTRCLFTYESMIPEASEAHGKAVSLFYDDGVVRAAVVNFPLSMMEEDAAGAALRRIIAELGYSDLLPGDYNGDGMVNAVDIVMLISWLFRAGPPPLNPANADVNADCRSNLIDVVILVNYIYRVGPPPGPGCAQ